MVEEKIDNASLTFESSIVERRATVLIFSINKVMLIALGQNELHKFKIFSDASKMESVETNSVFQKEIGTIWSIRAIEALPFLIAKWSGVSPY
jgi:hypothetical protein